MVSFAQPLILSFLAVLSVPVVLHLMHRQVPVRIVFPSIRFIRKAQLPRAGRRRLRDLLLLFLRLGVLSLLILAFAGPRVVRRAAPSVTAAARPLTVVLLDASASMLAEGVSARVRQALEELWPTLGSEHAVLIRSANRILAVTGPTADVGDLRAAVADWQPEPVAGNHRAALEAAGALLRREPAGGRLVLVSDFRQSDWGGHDAYLPPGTEVECVDVAPAEWENVGIVAVSVTPLAGERIRVVATVRNFSDSVQGRSVTVDVGDHTAAQAIELPPLQNRRVVFSLDSADAREGIARLSADQYPADDRYHFWLGAVPPVELLAVIPGDAEPDKAVELFFLRKALSVRGDSDRLSFRLEVVDAASFFALDLSSIRAVFLLGAGGYLRAAGFTALRAYVESGGTVIATPGDLAAHAYHGFRSHGLLAGRFLSLVGSHERRGEQHGISWVNPEGVLGRSFADTQESDLYLFPIHRYIAVSPAESEVVLLRLSSSDPALIERSVGSGRFFLSAFGFEPRWSDLPLTSSYLPLLRELLASAVPSGYGVRRIACGESLPRISHLLGSPSRGGSAGDMLVAPHEPGVVLLDNEWPVEVNVSRQESDGAVVNLHDLRRALSGLDARSPPHIGENAAATPQVTELWHILAGGALLLVLLELLISGVADFREAWVRTA